MREQKSTHKYTISRVYVRRGLSSLLGASYPSICRRVLVTKLRPLRLSVSPAHDRLFIPVVVCQDAPDIGFLFIELNVSRPLDAHGTRVNELLTAR